MKTTRKIAALILSLVIAFSMAIPSFATLSVSPRNIRKDHITYVNKEFILYTQADGSVSYKSSDENLAKVDSDGKVTVLAPGECTITITNEATNETEDYDFTIRAGGITGISYATIYYGTTRNLNYNGKEGLIYESSNPRIASVDSEGNVKSNGIGTCVINITDPETGAHDYCEVRVELIWWEFWNNIIYFIKNLLIL